jgi:hypothetical protein
MSAHCVCRLWQNNELFDAAIACCQVEAQAKKRRKTDAVESSKQAQVRSTSRGYLMQREVGLGMNIWA